MKAHRFIDLFGIEKANRIADSVVFEATHYSDKTGSYYSSNKNDAVEIKSLIQAIGEYKSLVLAKRAYETRLGHWNQALKKSHLRYGVLPMNLSKQEFLSVGDSSKYIQDKRKLRDELEREMKKYIKRGGVIKPAENQPIKINHGTNTKYTKMGCRCEICMRWALKNGLIKTTTLRERS